MTEQEWQECSVPARMFNAIWPHATNRKLRLLACALCRRRWEKLTDERSRKAVVLAELYADSLAVDAELQKAREEAQLVIEGMCAEERFEEAVLARQARVVVEREKHRLANREEAWFDSRDWVIRTDSNHCEHIRDVFGNPFRPPTIVLPTWQTATVVSLAQAIYDERAFDRMPILADALEEAGCTNADVLNHCREPGEHVRGCWVVDLLLGKK